jgi:hypothetical protein
MNGAGRDPERVTVLLSSRAMETLHGDAPGIMASRGVGSSGHGMGCQTLAEGRPARRHKVRLDIADPISLPGSETPGGTS